jgi:hypothetical protein
MFEDTIKGAGLTGDGNATLVISTVLGAAPVCRR